MITHEGLNVTTEVTVGPFYVPENHFHSISAVGLTGAETIDVYIGRAPNTAQLKLDSTAVQLSVNDMAKQVEGPFKYYLHKGITTSGILVESAFDSKESIMLQDYQG